jgi:acyl dehydratase
VTGPHHEILDQPTMPLEAGKVAELARALRADPAVLPPTYTVLAAHHTPPARSPHELLVAAAGLDPARVLLGSMEWVHHRAPRVGSVLAGTVRLDGTTTKESRQAGTLRIASGSVIWRDAEGTVAEVRSTLLEPGRTPNAAAGSPATATGAVTGEAAETEERLELSRTDIVRYAGASGDFNPVHHDHKAAQARGYPDVFAMGLLPGGILAARLTASSGPAGHTVAIAFRGIVWPDTSYTVEVVVHPTGGTASLRDPQGQAVVEATVQAGPTPSTDSEVTR